MPILHRRPRWRTWTACFGYAFSGEAKFPGYVQPQAHAIDGPFWLAKTKLSLFRSSTEMFIPLLSCANSQGICFRLHQRLQDRPGRRNRAASRRRDTLVLGTPFGRSHFSHLSLEEGIALSAKMNREGQFSRT